ncbi:MAG: lytic murein transglycosylase B [Sideroxydans sp.]|nr:lytic murein transglycosylase B [Sideroxydans sp.]
MKKLLSALLCLCLTDAAVAANLPGIPEFIDEMVAKHQFRRAELNELFARAEHRPDIIEAITKPATLKPWPEYRAAFVNAKRVKLGVAFWDKHQRTLQRAEQEFGVPAEIIVAIIGVETIYGKNAGTFRTLDALTTLAFDYPRRAPFFRAELENYLLLARDQDFNLLAIKSSYAGALGIPQFMPSSYRNYALDYNGNHKIDLLKEEIDAIGSVANYMKGYGWLANQPVATLANLNVELCVSDLKTIRSMADWAQVGIVPQVSNATYPAARISDYTLGDAKEFWLVFNNFEVITKYNNSDFYAMSVVQLAQAIKAARANSYTQSGVPRN